MKRKDLQEGWSGLSNEGHEGVAEWRVQHPKVTLREIEGEIDKRLSELRVRIISDTVNASASAVTDSAAAKNNVSRWRVSSSKTRAFWSWMKRQAISIANPNH